MEILHINNEKNKAKTSSIAQDQQPVINKARCMYYNLFGILFIYGELEKKYDKIINILEQIFTNPMNETAKDDIFKLLKELESHQTKNITYEFNELFINNFNTKAINLTMSYYDEGYERGEKYLLAKQLIKKSKFRRNESFVETEDDLGFLCMLNATLLDDTKEESILLAKEIFEKIINPYVNYIIVEILKNTQAIFYKPVARILSSFMEFERIYLDAHMQKYQAFVDKSEALYQEKNPKLKKRQKTPISMEEIVAKADK
ncbi:molecular chaperone TorD family protein [Helicobacter sp. 11S03491-1]|uniref:TorD/DmsD family molecular chaperone n=1 Tax=Helicobacter sp. 11S03491-1 TaxID=1476196 RepID=UPI000BA5323B|nr:molecular chaperone TorD family protein [Helicobacter sp. 11S03491-1]PAF43827.1 hypothetical protein BKH45_00755 [Helicobacter sp. 11S03491-1]